MEDKLKHTKLTVLNDIKPTFMKKSSPGCCKSLINLQNPQMLILIVCQFSLCFYEEIDLDILNLSFFAHLNYFWVRFDSLSFK